ncbi:MAG TPA: DNA methyltransferase [Methylocella sp.]|nr:DNA methyltransferase [Methylocella sp.]
MLVDALFDLTNRGDIVLDPFLGSGSTLIAAERTGRCCRGVELDPLYIDVVLRRCQPVNPRFWKRPARHSTSFGRTAPARAATPAAWLVGIRHEEAESAAVVLWLVEVLDQRSQPE